MTAFRDVVVWRRGALPATALATLVPERALGLLDEAEQAEPALTELAEPIADALFALVPALAAPARRAVLKLRRDLYNGRLPRPDVLAAARAGLPADLDRQLTRWLGSRQEQQDRWTHADAVLDEELAAARVRLAELVDGDLLSGVLLSGRELYRSVLAYRATVLAAGGRPSGARTRTAERSVLAFAARMALKPTPFGAFTEIGTQPWHPEPAATDGQRRSRVRLNRGMLTWLANEVRHAGERDRLLRVRLNDTVVEAGGQVRFFRRGLDGTAETMGGERFAAARISDGVRVLVDALRDDSMLREDVLDLLVAKLDVDRDAAGEFVDRLAGAGLCHCGLDVPDQEERFAGAVAERLAAVTTDDGQRWAEIFGGLQRIEDEFAVAGVGRRVALLDELDRVVDSAVAASGQQALGKGASVAQTLVFEDVGRTGPAAGWCPDVLTRNEGHFAALGALLPVFDESTILGLALYRHFSAAGPVPLLDYYREFATQPPPVMSRLMTGVGDERADAVREHRGAFLDHLVTLAASDAEEVALDSGWLRGYLAGLPDFLPAWDSFSVRVQFADTAGRRVAVVNKVMTGHGAYFSRFCDLVDTEAWSATRALRADIERNSPRQADLTAALGLNISLHPRLTPNEIVYPGSVAQQGDRSPLSLRDLLVEPDHQRCRLRLRSRVDGEVIDLVPMSFLFPAAAPPLYRFLCALSPIRSVRGDWWNRLPMPPGRSPRLTMGDLVLDRRSWRLPAAGIPRPSSVESVAGLADFRAWQRAHGLPDTVFYRLADERGEQGETTWIDETKRWAARTRRARLTKRQFLDLRNPLLLNVFLRHVDDGDVILQECLPDAGQVAATGHGAEEFLIELTATDWD